MTNIVSYRPIQTTSITFYTCFVVLTVYLKLGPRQLRHGEQNLWCILRQISSNPQSIKKEKVLELLRNGKGLQLAIKYSNMILCETSTTFRHFDRMNNSVYNIKLKAREMKAYLITGCLYSWKLSLKRPLKMLHFWKRWKYNTSNLVSINELRTISSWNFKVLTSFYYEQCFVAMFLINSHLPIKKRSYYKKKKSLVSGAKRK